MRRILGVLLVFFAMCCFCLVGTVFADESVVSVSLDSPESSRSYKPGDNVEIIGTAENVPQVSLVVFNSAKSIAYVAQPPVVNGVFSSGFQLDSDAVEGVYTIKIGAEGLGVPAEFTFKVEKESTSPPSGGGGGGGGGGGNTPKPEKPDPNIGETDSTPKETGSEPTPGETVPATIIPSFNDIDGHWAAGSIKQLVAIGAINGYPDGSFRPDNTITRAEFAAVLVKAFRLEQQSDITFQDTFSHWARDYIATVVAGGVANGYNSDIFGPDDPITREQMAVMVVRAARLEPATGQLNFADRDSISAWAREAIATITEYAFMQGYSDNTIKPQNNATRGEAAAIIVKVQA